jgi:hypothetical protein
MFVLV